MGKAGCQLNIAYPNQESIDASLVRLSLFLCAGGALLVLTARACVAPMTKRSVTTLMAKPDNLS